MFYVQPWRRAGRRWLGVRGRLGETPAGTDSRRQHASPWGRTTLALEIGAQAKALGEGRTTVWPEMLR